MSFLYLTADHVGLQTGGGAVTREESQALKELGPCDVWDRKELEKIKTNAADPWQWDTAAKMRLPSRLALGEYFLVHGYAGTFTETIRQLKEQGRKVTWTCAAHDVEKSRDEHATLGIPFQYDHLNIPEQFERYIGGYKLADVLITPSKHSYDVLRRQGCTNRIEIVEHGCYLPLEVKPLPKRFVLGYAGSAGADKGLIYLIQAWAKLNYKDAMFIIAGRDSTHPAVRYLVQQMGAGNVHLAGWYENLSDFYHSISLYVQPSVTEGFGLEVLEGMAHSRPVICSDGAGAVDLVPEGWRFPAGDVDALVEGIRKARNLIEGGYQGHDWRAIAADHTWEKVRAKYQTVWKELLK